MRLPRSSRKVRAGDYREGPFNHVLTDQEKKVLGLIDHLRTSLHDLKTELARTPRNACSPPENFHPQKMEQFDDIEQSLDSLDLELRWIPGGVYRYETGDDR